AVSHITIEGSGATLQGPGTIGDPKSLERAGRGIELQGCVDVTVRHLSAHGFATGLAARDGQGLVIEDCDFSDNYDNPKHGWGELPSRGGVLLQRVRQSVVRRTKAARVWNGLELVDSDENQIEDNDLSHCSNTGVKLWHSSRNRLLRNNISFGIRI